MKMIVGLGNPGKEYEYTRHNIGFIILDQIIDNFVLEKKFQAYIATKVINQEKCIFVKPTTFMNLSGDAVGKIAKYYDINIKDILIIQDDLDMNFGKIKLKINSSSGGHNGIKSIINTLGTNEFARLKFGISHDRSIDTVDYVLGKFSKEDLTYIKENRNLYEEIITSFVENGVEVTMNRYNN